MVSTFIDIVAVTPEHTIDARWLPIEFTGDCKMHQVRCFRPPSDMNLAVLFLVSVASKHGGVREPAVEGNYPEQYGPAR